MNTIHETTYIKGPIERCFKLATSIDMHKLSASQTQEEAIAGVTSGLIRLNETVTWRAKHFGIWHQLTTKITEFDEPNYFVDEMIKGSFKFMKHTHKFRSTEEGGTLMTGAFEFLSPLGFLGKMVDKLVLVNHMTQFLKERNAVIKEFAETEGWREVLIE